MVLTCTHARTARARFFNFNSLQRGAAHSCCSPPLGTYHTMIRTNLFLLCCLVIFSVACSFTVAPQNTMRRCCVVFMSEEGSNAPVANDEPVKQEVACPDCDLCDGSGRILGGIGVLLPWWPIKAYRPCPNFIERGGTYQRSGQGLDEIAFGRDSTFDQD
jgi:hypothetical protein